MTMQTQESLTPHLAALRRFARAVLGSRKQGDAAVAGLMSSAGDEADRPLTALLQQLNRSMGGGSDAHRALLLRDAEGLSLREIAAVLGCGPAEVTRLMQEAEAGRPARSLRILIIESEPDIGLGLREILERQGHMVADIVPTCLKALDARRQRQPDLVIADLQLADGSSGLEAARQLLDAFEVPVICLTAFPERLLTGEGPEPAFVVQKPYAPALIASIVRQAAEFTRKTPVTA